jgi:hypothetical protein
VLLEAQGWEHAPEPGEDGYTGYERRHGSAGSSSNGIRDWTDVNSVERGGRAKGSPRRSASSVQVKTTAPRTPPIARPGTGPSASTTAPGTATLTTTANSHGEKAPPTRQAGPQPSTTGLRITSWMRRPAVTSNTRAELALCGPVKSIHGASAANSSNDRRIRR